MTHGRPRSQLAVWDDRIPSKKRTVEKVTTTCPGCGRPVVSPASAPRVYCHAGCRRAAQDAVLRLEANTLKVAGDGCWLWQGGRNASGYGILSVGHRTVFAHRLALELALGRPLGADLALHKCNNPSCVRVGAQHVYAGDHAQNMRDLADSNTGRGSKTSWDDRLVMAERAAAGEPWADVGRDFGVTAPTVGRWFAHFFPSSGPGARPPELELSPTPADGAVELSLDEAALHDPYAAE